MGAIHISDQTKINEYVIGIDILRNGISVEKKKKSTPYWHALIFQYYDPII